MPSIFEDLSVTSIGFFIFIAISFVVYYSASKKQQNLILLLGSYFFCVTWGISFVIILVVYSLFNFWVAMRIDTLAIKHKNRWLWAGVLANIGALAFYKYFHQIQHLGIRGISYLDIQYEYSPINILQPIGISFYTLQAISYLVDVYRGQIPANKSLLETSLYLSYFPKLMAGPIERAGIFFKQLNSAQEVKNSNLINSFVQIFIGLTRKIVISETILEAIPQRIFTNPMAFSSPDLIFWWLTFTFVIYNDFAGYTSIALGISELFGIKLTQNFRQPFLSTSIIDFWNRWHISLSNWLRDYVYLPMSRWMLRRNSSGKYLPNLIIPPFVTMLISGIWHGTTLNFVIWGALNGLFQGAERIRKSRKKNTKELSGIFSQVVSIFGTFLILVFISIPFKFDITESLMIWKKFLVWNDTAFILSINNAIKPVMAIFLSFIIDFFQLPNNNEEKFDQLSQNARVVLVATGILLLFLATRQETLTPFIYQEF